jgi:hypothetical protein
MKVEDWISIEKEMPVAGKIVLLCHAPLGFFTVAHWNDFKNYWQRGIIELDWVPTHWMELIEPTGLSPYNDMRIGPPPDASMRQRFKAGSVVPERMACTHPSKDQIRHGYPCPTCGLIL